MAFEKEIWASSVATCAVFRVPEFRVGTSRLRQGHVLSRPDGAPAVEGRESEHPHPDRSCQVQRLAHVRTLRAHAAGRSPPPGPPQFTPPRSRSKRFGSACCLSPSQLRWRAGNRRPVQDARDRPATGQWCDEAESDVIRLVSITISLPQLIAVHSVRSLACQTTGQTELRPRGSPGRSRGCPAGSRTGAPPGSPTQGCPSHRPGRRGPSP